MKAVACRYRATNLGFALALITGCSSEVGSGPGDGPAVEGGGQGAQGASGAPAVAGGGSAGAVAAGLGGSLTSGGDGSGGGGVVGTAGSSGASTVAGASSGGSGGEVAVAGSGGVPASGGAAGGGGTGGNGVGGGVEPVPYEIPTIVWPSTECESQVNTLIGQMTVAEKAAQMVMGQNPNAGSVSSSGLGAVFSGGTFQPSSGTSASSWAGMVDSYIQAGNDSRLSIPILYGVDAVHGQNKSTGTVIFPHNAGLGCTQNPALVEEVGRITAIEAAASGISWTFAPVLSVSFDDRWGRVYESFSEDPALTGLLGAAVTLGLQGRGGVGSGAPGIVACAKHFAGDGQATAGTSSKGGILDRGNIEIDDAEMQAYGIDPYLPAIQAGLGSVMVSDARWNGANMTSHGELVTNILKGEIGFQGFVATDWNAAVDSGGGVVSTINAGVDMLMQPDSWQATIDTIVNNAGGAISNARIDDAARRVLTVKCEAGLFDATRDTSLMAQVGSAAHREVGRRAVRESLVLLQNEGNVLPLAKGGNVWVGGSGANSLDRQCGGWTISWQNGGGQTEGTTVVEAVGKLANVVGNMADADVGVVVLSEPPYAEFLGDNASIDTLPGTDFALLNDLAAAGKPVVAIVISGRPVLISDELADADVWIAAWLPGTEGDGIADVLFGDYAPTGKLSHSWPRTQNQTNVNIGDPGYDPLFPLSHGLTY